ncbi:hypothetical protein [Spirillospora sp. NPDC048819]|uniref:hypothetical protein n=1 Tax=Spirillospora sp. NPDC048819 TaxID=3155268 RepID=UPI0033E5E8E8
MDITRQVADSHNEGLLPAIEGCDTMISPSTSSARKPGITSSAANAAHRSSRTNGGSLGIAVISGLASDPQTSHGVDALPDQRSPQFVAIGWVVIPHLAARRRAATGRALPRGFAGHVDQRFANYFARYVPRNTSTAVWLAETAGIRKNLRDEIVEVYREQRIGVERIAWLIRYRVSDVRTRWENGTLWSYRQELAIPPATTVMTMLGLTMLVLGGARTLVSAAQIAPLSTVRSTAFALLASVIAAHAWLHVVLERRRYEADIAEKRRTLKGCEAAFERWSEKLADRPSDPEMATWLDRDRKVFLDEALRHYGLAMSHMIAHAFIETRGSRGRRARVRNGPWRYERYKLLLFLLTTDGVRQLNAELDFALGTFHDRARTNYRYEAVAAVRVRQLNDDEHDFSLTLVNGEGIHVEATAPAVEELQDEPPGVVSEVSRDAMNLRHTLHVMEGIAAEGKRWATRERQRTATGSDGRSTAQ